MRHRPAIRRPPCGLVATGRFLRPVALTLTLMHLVAAATAAAERTPPGFYPGVTEPQSMRAHEALRAFHEGDFADASRRLVHLDAMERRDSLPPLGRLLHAAMIGLTLQRDDAIDSTEVAVLRARFDSVATDGLRRCAARGGDAPDPTCLVIEGGIRGFRAILKLNTHSPANVLAEGLGAVALLETALAEDSTIRDGHMGLGIFNMLATSNAPAPVRGMLRAAGRGVSAEAGLAHLRRSAYEGQYTSTASQFYLIRFLSPYDDELRREKYAIFASLRAAYPRSANALFLEAHESLCFHPDSFYRPGARADFARRLRSASLPAAGATAHNPAARRALELARLQYTLLDPAPPARLAPDSTFDLGGYAFYPAFIDALRLRREIITSTPNDPVRAERLKVLARKRKSLLERLHGTEFAAQLSPQNRAHLAWQVGDALRSEVFLARSGSAAAARQEAPSAGSADSKSNSAGKSRKPAER